MHERHEALEATLLSQAQSLRALARGLLGDDHAAQDVVQETWLVGLRSGASALRGGWLRGVAGHLAKKRQRADRSRSHHETRAAKPETTAATDVKAAEREVMRMVVDAVSELEEPYKSVIFMRYYQDLAPRLIAQERGVPVATVKSQLHRGLARLRERLDELSGGQRELWAGVLASSLGAPGMRTVGAVKVAAGALVLVAGIGVGLSDGVRSVEGPPAQTVGGGPHTLPASVQQAPKGGTDGSARAPVVQDGERVVLVTDAPLADVLGHAPFVYSMEIELLNNKDLPVRNASVYLNPVNHPINVVGTTDETGRLFVRWRGYEDSMNMVLGVNQNGLMVGAFRQVACKAGETLALRMPTQQVQTFVGWNGGSAAGEKPDPGLRKLGFAAVARGKLPFGVEVQTAVRIGTSGEVQFMWLPQVTDRSGDPMFEDKSSGMAGNWALGLPSSGTFRLNAPDTREKWRVTGVVLGADGQPAAGALLVARGKSQTVYANTDEMGAYELKVLPEAKLELRAGGGGYGIAQSVLKQNMELALTSVLWNPVLDRGNETTGVLRAGGAPATGPWCVEAELATDGGLYCDFTAAHTGAFAIPNLPAAGGQLVLTHRDSWPLAVAVLDGRAPSQGNMEFDLQQVSTEGATFEVMGTASSSAPADIEVRLWQLSSGRFVFLNYDSERQLHSRQSVPPGLYRLSVGNGAFGYRDLGTQLVENEDVQVGPLAPVETGELQLTVNGAAPDLGPEWTWTLRRRANGVDSALGWDPTQSGGALELPEGEYRLTLSSAEVLLPCVPFQVQAGRVLTFDLDLEHLGELVVFRAPQAPEATGEYRVLDANGALELRRGHLQPGQAERLHLPPGNYVLDRAGSRETFVIVADGQLVL